ncbi:MAG: hypothetical protein HUU35_05800, partial [Armatimonadetes bacterium]|nr:hypothetical protein [Armatimonadota bacterium]
LWRAGWRIDYLPSASIIHHGGGSTRQVRPAMVAESRDALLAYYAKHERERLGPLGYPLAVALIRLAFAVRLWRLR